VTLWHDPTGGAWALYPPVELAAVLFAAAVTPVVVMMFRRRGQETMMDNDETTIIDRDETGMVVTRGTNPEAPGPAEIQTLRVVPEHRAAAKVPTMPVPIARVECEHCGGTGYMPGINDMLNESAGLIGDHGDEVVRLFYGVLLRAAPDLLALFPGDPRAGEFGTDHRGADQREKLLRALVALADLYDPSIPAKMDRLDMALRQFGRSHAAFARPDGTARAATLEEYAAVKEALFTTLARFAQDQWKPEYTAAWSQAYDYAAGVMIAEQYRSGFSAARFPRV
jgi:hemoglobin-like flavoprotein